jgi:hypothetical protein
MTGCQTFAAAVDPTMLYCPASSFGLPPMSVGDGAEVAAAVGLVFAAVFAVRTMIRMVML